MIFVAFEASEIRPIALAVHLRAAVGIHGQPVLGDDGVPQSPARFAWRRAFQACSTTSVSRSTRKARYAFGCITFFASAGIS